MKKEKKYIYFFRDAMKNEIERPKTRSSKSKMFLYF